MALLPVDVPAAIYRRARDAEPGVAGEETLVAKGPLVIMAHGLMAIAPEDRDAFCIRCALGCFDAGEIEEALRGWTASHAPQAGEGGQ